MDTRKRLMAALLAMASTLVGVSRQSESPQREPVAEEPAARRPTRVAVIVASAGDQRDEGAAGR